MDWGMVVESRPAHRPRRLARLRGAVPAPVRDIVSALREHRTLSISAAAAFYGLLSVPPFLVALIATGAVVAIALGPDFVEQLSSQILSAASELLSPDAVDRVVEPSIDRVLEQPNVGILALGFVVALWSSSRMISVVLQGIQALTDSGNNASVLATRFLAVKALIAGLLAIALFLPILAVGPGSLLSFLGASWILALLGWLAVTMLGVMGVAAFYRMAIPRKPKWKHALLGAGLAILGWGVGSGGLQIWTTQATSGETSIYGPLSAPIALLLWLQLIAWMTLLGAAIINQFSRPPRDTYPANQEQ
jgi:membrane protein